MTFENDEKSFADSPTKLKVPMGGSFLGNIINRNSDSLRDSS